MDIKILCWRNHGLWAKIVRKAQQTLLFLGKSKQNTLLRMVAEGRG